MYLINQFQLKSIIILRYVFASAKHIRILGINQMEMILMQMWLEYIVIEEKKKGEIFRHSKSRIIIYYWIIFQLQSAFQYFFCFLSSHYCFDKRKIEWSNLPNFKYREQHLTCIWTNTQIYHYGLGICLGFYAHRSRSKFTI